MQVLNVNSSLEFKTGGGTAERTFQMSHFLAKEGAQCTVLTIETGLDNARISALRPATVVTLPLLWKRFFVPKLAWKTIEKLVKDADVVHLMGHWSALNALVYLAARKTGTPYVVCPAGALPLFGRSKAIKWLYNLILGKSIIRNAAAWIAVTPAEFPHFERYGVPASRITVVANGVSEFDFPEVDKEKFRLERKLPNKPMILFMGRLNPIKGPDLLLRAFNSVARKFPDYHLIFAGPDGGMQSGLYSYAKENGIADRVHFLGFVSGESKVAAYRLATLLVVPSRQEAMSIVALEAGICGTPVLLTDQCGFHEIKSVYAGLEVSADVSGIASGITDLLENSERLGQLAVSFQRFVSEHYTWNSIVSEYLRLYKTVLTGTEKA